jgi:hypothetical protein
LTTAEELVIATLQARDAHPRWGPRKLYVLLGMTIASRIISGWAREPGHLRSQH